MESILEDYFIKLGAQGVPPTAQKENLRKLANLDLGLVDGKVPLENL